MAYDGVVDDVHKAIDLERPDRMPVLACSEELNVRRYGKCEYEEVCQDGDRMAEAELRVDIINCGPAADMTAVRKTLTGKCCFSGNLDPIEVLRHATPEQVASNTERIVKTCYSDDGYAFCTGEMNPRDVPVGNMKAMIEAARRASE